jgi:hypothetical protein
MRPLFKTLLFFAVLGVLVILALGSIFLEDEPRLAEMPAPTPEDVIFTKEFVKQVRAATEATGPGADIVILPLKNLQGVMRLGARFLPGFRGSAAIESDVVHGTASVPVPWITGRKWLNLRATAPAFEGRIAFTSITLGDRLLPPGFALTLGRITANLLFGNRAGDTILASATSMRIESQTLVFTLDLDEDGRGDVINGVFGALRDADMPPPEEIDRYYVMIREAMDAGTLPTEGSYLPYIRFALKAALAGSSTAENLPNAYTAALFGLAKACGAKDFTLIVGRLAGDPLKDFGTWKTDCSEVTLAGRIDTRRHFTTAAAIKAASNRGFAISVGEFKELHDSISGAGGFDFTDIAANNSGIRMSDLFMSQPSEAWTDLIARLQTEGDVLASFEGIPSIMLEEEFKARFGDVTSPAYYDMLTVIEKNIDKVALHAATP